MKTSFKDRYFRIFRSCSSTFSLTMLVVLMVPTLILGQLLAGCSTVSAVVTELTPSDSLAELKKISLSADRLSNFGSPVAVDLVLIFDQKRLTMLGALRAGDWFKSKPDLLRQYPNQFQVTSWEIVPGQVLKPLTPPDYERKLVGVLIFANYPGEKSFRADASNMPSVRVNLFKDDFSIAGY
jgi:hypothetical protein